MENFQVPGVISQNRIDGNPGRRMTPLENSGPAFIVCRDGDDQPALAGYRNNEEEITYGQKRP
jgi:hypothetical protein